MLNPKTDIKCHSERSEESLGSILRSFVVSLLRMTAGGVFTLLLFTSPAFAQTPASASSTIPYTLTPIPSSVSPTSPLYTDLIVNNMFHTFSCLMIGGSLIGQPCLTYQVQKNAEGAIQTVPVLSQVNLSGGALGATTSLIGALYANPPLRTADYIGSLGQQLGFVKTVHAQVFGSGANVLSPILALWQVSRNISYLAMIVVFLIIGLMVLFRNRINPQTVITAQAALPGLVIGLILITFSYFLAGLISDMAFVGTNLVGYYFSIAQRPDKTPQNLVSDISQKNILSIFVPFTKTANLGEINTALSSIWSDLHDPTQGNGPLDLDPQRVIVILTGFLTTQLLSPFANIAGGWSQIVIGVASALGAGLAPVQVASFALSFIAMAILIYAMFRLLLRLISAFLTIIFLTVTSPFQFLAASLPGRQGIATGWILNMLGNILIFPTVLAVLYFVAYLLGSENTINSGCPSPCTFNIYRITSQSNSTPDNNFVIPAYAQDGLQTNRIVGKESFPLFGGMNLGFIQLLLAFGALVALPKIPDLVVSTIGRAGQAGQLLGQEISGSIGQGRQYAGQIQGGAGKLAGDVGRVTSERGYQMVQDPANPGSFKRIPIETPGQFGRIGRNITILKTRWKNRST